MTAYQDSVRRLRGVSTSSMHKKTTCTTSHMSIVLVGVCCSHVLLLLLQDDLRGHHLPDSGERAYVISKTYILMSTTRELARRLEGTAVDVMAGNTHHSVLPHSLLYKASRGM